MENYDMIIIAFLVWYLVLIIHIYGKFYRYLIDRSSNLVRDWKLCRKSALYHGVVLPVPTFIFSLLFKTFKNTKGYEFSFFEPPFDLLLHQEVNFSNNVDIWYNNNPYLMCHSNIRDNIVKYWEIL